MIFFYLLCLPQPINRRSTDFPKKPSQSLKLCTIIFHACMLLFIIVSLCLFQCLLSTYLVREDRACDPARSNIIFPYTGFRIQRQYTYGLTMLHHVRLSHCSHGSVDMSSILPIPRNTDILWATNMCVDASHCYRLVRKKKYSQRNLSFYLPNVAVGGIFQCPLDEPCSDSNSKPILPLLADHLSYRWFEFARFRRIVKRVPYLYTPYYVDPRYPHRPDTSEWYKDLDVNENYTFTSQELHLVSHATNKALNVLYDYLDIDPAYLPWEHNRSDLDALVAEALSTLPAAASFQLLLQLDGIWNDVDIP